MCNNKDKLYVVYAFLILFGITILLLCGTVREAIDDIESGYSEQSAGEASLLGLTKVVSDTSQ